MYEELAESLEEETDVVIAKMDGVDNEHEDVDAQGFPTILFFPAEEGAAPITFSGDRTVQVCASYRSVTHLRAGVQVILIRHSGRAW